MLSGGIWRIEGQEELCWVKEKRYHKKKGLFLLNCENSVSMSSVVLRIAGAEAACEAR